MTNAGVLAFATVVSMANPFASRAAAQEATAPESDLAGAETPRTIAPEDYGTYGPRRVEPGTAPAPRASAATRTLTVREIDGFRRTLIVERSGIVWNALGLGVFIIGLSERVSAHGQCIGADCVVTDPSLDDMGRTTAIIGGAIAASGSVIAGSAAVTASNRLRLMGIRDHREGLAISALVVSAVPIVGSFVSLILGSVHERMTTRTVRRLLPRQEPGVSFRFVPLASDTNAARLGSSLELRF